jgi:hypothetical protein
MERTPIKSRWLSYAISLHEDMLLRRQIEKELRSKPDCRSVYMEMYPYYLLTFTIPLYSLYILRKEPLMIKCIAFSGIFSMSYINTKLRLERDMFYRRGFTQTPTGKVIRSIYIDRKPQSATAESYKEYDRKLEALLGKYYPRENPLERFREYEISKQ